MNAFLHKSIKNTLYGLLFAVLTLSATVSKAQDGQKLFKSYCASCHYANDGQLVGPGLKGITEKYEMSWILKWVKNSQELIQSGDAQAIASFEKHNKIIMPAQPVTDEEIKAIFAYVDESNAAAAAAPADGASGDAVMGSETAAPVETTSPYLIFFGAIVVLLIVIGILRKVNYSLATVVDKDAAGEEKDMWSALLDWGAKNRKFVVLLVLGLIVLVAKAGWDAALNVGIYTNYQPEQPIKFSHMLHAGDNKIDCNYCHSGARNSKSAGIPSPSLCMNCHTYINEGPQYGKEEIAKIYKALDFDPITKTYGDNTSPIKWIKVHNLPDHVYFNHSQHVTVGQIACQKCHGPVEEEYTVGKQFAPLTMGWCIDCHKETKVQTEGNGYYDEIHKRLPEDLKAKYLENGVINVDELGGIECAKCHY